ncbi:MAG: DUF2232 domain-containing protein [Candidatus Desulforudis sp.]|nr:DUF2232 domain-containing protein [Desulforudis sp.]
MFQPGTLRQGVSQILACTVLALIGLLIPVLLLACGLGITLMMAVLTNRHTAVHALTVLVLSALLAVWFPGALDTVMILLQFGVLGLFYGLCFKNRVAHQKILGAGVVMALLLGGFSLAVAFLVTGQTPGEMTAAGVVTGDHPELFEQVAEITALLMPGSFIVSAIIVAWAGFFLTAGILRRLDYLRSPGPEFQRWRLPWPVIWVLIAGLALTLVGDQWAVYPLAVAGKNVLFVMVIALLLGGLTLAAYFHRALSGPRWLKLLVLVGFLVCWPFNLTVLALAGLVDTWIDCRAWYERRGDKR